MEAKFISTRSISLDIFDLKRKQDRYAQHLSKLNQIEQMKTKTFQKAQVQKVKNITDQMHKTRQISRKFRQKEEQYRRKLEDSKMLKNIINRQYRKQYATGNQRQQAFLHSTIHQRMIDQIKIESQNKKLAMHLLNQQIDVKNYKKKMHTQSKQYLELKRHLNKFKIAKLLTQKAEKEWASQKRVPFPSVLQKKTKSMKKYNKNLFSKDQKITEQIRSSILLSQKS